MEELVCPECGEGILEELEEDPSGMTEGQQANYEMGFDRPFMCPNCGCTVLMDSDDVYIDEIDDLLEELIAGPETMEDLIEHALESGCLIEAISLIHNTIEAYLKFKINEFSDKNKKDKIKLHYLKSYNGISYLLGLIDIKLYREINKFNNDRNHVIHKLMKNPKKLEDIWLIAKRGRKIQLQLSPIKHSKSDIELILKRFDEMTK